MKKRKKISKKCNVRLFFALLVFGSITSILGYNLYSNLITIKEMKIQKKELQSKIVLLREEKNVLEGDILKLENPDYIAKYVREKYFYSKDGELILRMDD